MNDYDIISEFISLSETLTGCYPPAPSGVPTQCLIVFKNLQNF
jgi:hypothetical protein